MGKEAFLGRFRLLAGPLPAESAQIVELCPPDVPVGRHFNLLQKGGMIGEGAFHTDPMQDLPYRESGSDSALPGADDDAGKYLRALSFALNDSVADSDSVTRAELGDIWVWLKLNDSSDIHFTNYPSQELRSVILTLIYLFFHYLPFFWGEVSLFQ